VGTSFLRFITAVHAFDRETDGRTDGRTENLHNTVRCIQWRILHYMQSQKHLLNGKVNEFVQKFGNNNSNTSALMHVQYVEFSAGLHLSVQNVGYHFLGVSFLSFYIRKFSPSSYSFLYVDINAASCAKAKYWPTMDLLFINIRMNLIQRQRVMGRCTLFVSTVSMHVDSKLDKGE